MEGESPLASFSSQEVVPVVLPGTMPYVAVQHDFPALPGTEFYETKHRAVLRQRLFSIVAGEEPITMDLAARYLLASFGLVRLTAKAKAHLVVAILPMAPELVLEDDVLWLSLNERASWRGVRIPDVSGSSRRTIEDIPLCELMNCAELVLRQNLALPRVDLARETARAFGIVRLGANVQVRLQTAVDALFASGRATDDNGQIRLGTNVAT